MLGESWLRAGRRAHPARRGQWPERRCCLTDQQLTGGAGPVTREPLAAPREPGQALQVPWDLEGKLPHRQAPPGELGGRGVQGEPRLPREAGLPAPRDSPPRRANTCRCHLWAVVFQGFAFLKDLGNILEQLNIALEAVPFTGLCSFNKHPLRACSVPDAPAVKRRRCRLGRKAVPGLQLGVTQGDRC